jgi:hypothetical protein
LFYSIIGLFSYIFKKPNQNPANGIIIGQQEYFCILVNNKNTSYESSD